MEQIDKKITKIHNYIYANEGLNNSETLNEFLKIFYCKILDEQNENIFSKKLNDEKIISNINLLFDKFKERLKGIIDSKEKINLKKETIIYIMTELRDIKFDSISADTKGHILQKIIDRSYRESRGQFFTPAPVVDFIVKMISPKKDEIGCDPACGTGGFMFSSLEYISEKSKINSDVLKNVYFYDISKSLINLIAMRMMFEFSNENPNFEVKDSIAESYDKEFDYILTNPPFGSQGKIIDSKILSKYSLGIDSNGNIMKSQVPDILFVEKIVQMLKIGGRSAVVLPDGDFENPSQDYFRKYLIDNTRIDAIVSLPDGTFIPYGTGVKSSIIFFTKLDKQELEKEINKNYYVFYGKITKLGYTFSKHSKDVLLKNGLPDEDYSKVLEAYKNKKYNEQSYVIPIKDIINNKLNLSESFYSPIYNRTIEKIKEKKFATLKELVEFDYSKIKINKEDNYKYIEIADINSYTNEIINCTEMLGEELPSRASYLLNENDLIVATAGNSIGTKKQSKALVSKEYAGCICTNGFTIMKAKKISPYYLLHFFNSDDFLNQILKYKYGTAIPCIGRKDFENIIVPIPTATKLTQIDDKIKKALELRDQANKLLNEI